MCVVLIVATFAPQKSIQRVDNSIASKDAGFQNGGRGSKMAPKIAVLRDFEQLQCKNYSQRHVLVLFAFYKISYSNNK